MSNYYIDFEFHSYKKNKNFLFQIKADLIEPISIGLVSDDGREYSAVCNEFDLKEAWDNNWIKENVLMPIFYELAQHDFNSTHFKDEWKRNSIPITFDIFRAFMADDFKWLESLIKKHGKSHQQIANDIINFVYPLKQWQDLHPGSYIDRDALCLGIGEFATVRELLQYSKEKLPHPKFYGYMSAFDYVCLTTIMGGMSKWPNGWKYYINDLAQMIDQKSDYIGTDLRAIEGYPENNNEHLALSDSRWNKKLHEFIQTI